MYGAKKLRILQSLKVLALLTVLIILFVKVEIIKNILLGRSNLYDFELYRTLSETIKLGENPYTPDLTFSLGPPTVFFYFLPFSYFDIGLARIITTVTNIIFGFLLCRILAKKFFPKNINISFLIISILLFSSFPARFSIAMGQPALILSFLISLVVTTKNNITKGLGLALIITLKTFYIFSLLAFFKKPKVLLAFTATVSILVLVSFIFIKPEWYLYYFQNIFPRLNDSPSPNSNLDYYNQSLKSTFYRLGLINSYPYIFPLISLVIGFLVLITGSFELSIVSAVLLSPISWQHYYTSLFPIFVWVYIRNKKSLMKIFILSISYLLWWAEFPLLHGAKNNLVNGVLASHFFISGLMLWILASPSQTLVKKTLEALRRSFSYR